MVSSFSGETANADCKRFRKPCWAIEMLNNQLLYLTSVVLLPPTGQIQAIIQAYYQKKRKEKKKINRPYFCKFWKQCVLGSELAQVPWVDCRNNTANFLHLSPAVCDRVSSRPHLRDDGQFLSEVMEPDGSNIYPINDDLAACGLQDSEEAVCQG